MSWIVTTVTRNISSAGLLESYQGELTKLHWFLIIARSRYTATGDKNGRKQAKGNSDQYWKLGIEGLKIKITDLLENFADKEKISWLIHTEMILWEGGCRKNMTPEENIYTWSVSRLWRTSSGWRPSWTLAWSRWSTSLRTLNSFWRTKTDQQELLGVGLGRISGIRQDIDGLSEISGKA